MVARVSAATIIGSGPFCVCVFATGDADVGVVSNASGAYTNAAAVVVPVEIVVVMIIGAICLLILRRWKRQVHVIPQDIFDDRTVMSIKGMNFRFFICIFTIGCIYTFSFPVVFLLQ